MDRDVQPSCCEANAGRSWGNVLSAICWHQRVDLLQVSPPEPAEQAALSDHTVYLHFSPTLFETLGLDYEMRLTLSGAMNVVQLVAVLFSLVMFEQLGRKTWLYVGSVGMTTSHLVVAVMIGTYICPLNGPEHQAGTNLVANSHPRTGKYSSDWKTHSLQAWIGVASIFTFMFAYGISFGPVAWVLPGEVHTSSYRAKGVALAVCSNWVNNFIIVSEVVVVYRQCVIERRS